MHCLKTTMQNFGVLIRHYYVLNLKDFLSKPKTLPDAHKRFDFLYFILLHISFFDKEENVVLLG